MDVAACLQAFERRFSSYTGDDPLDVWLQFVEYLDHSLPAGGGEMSPVLDRLLQNFIGVERYADDVRFVNMCIRCATYYSEPIALFHYIFNKGVGTRTAALYVAWAQCFERRAMPEQADAVYRKALEKRARPAESVMREQFQARSGSQEAASGGGPKPPDEPHPPSHGVPAAAPSQAAVEFPGSGAFYVRTVSRSETPSASGHDPDRVFVSMYSEDALAREGSELCFEEVRARTYFEKRKRQREADERQRRRRAGDGAPPLATFPSARCPVVSREEERAVRQDEEAASTLRCQLNQMCRTLTTCAAENASARPTQKAFGQEEGGSDAQVDENLNATSALNVPQVTPNKSLSCPHAAATPSRVSPSPTREAVDAIMGMFRAPALARDPFGDASAFFGARKPSDDANVSAPPASATAAEPFAIYQDDAGIATSRASAKSKAAPGRGLSENLPSDDKTADDLTVWGDGRLASCPDDTAEFALAARCMSTPFAHKGAVGASRSAVDVMMLVDRGTDDNTFIRRLHKLSPIMEQSPPDQKLSDTAGGQPAAHGTIVGEGLGGHQLIVSSATLAQASLPPAALSFKDRTLGSTAATEPFSILEDLEQNSRQEVVKKSSNSLSVRRDAAMASVRAPLGPPPPPADRHVASPEKERHRLSDAAMASIWAHLGPPPPADQHMASPEKERDRLSDAAKASVRAPLGPPPPADRHMASPEKERHRLSDAAMASIWAPLGPPPSPADQHMASPEKERHRLSDAAMASIWAPLGPLPPADRHMASPEKERHRLSDAAMASVWAPLGPPPPADRHMASPEKERDRLSDAAMASVQAPLGPPPPPADRHVASPEKERDRLSDAAMASVRAPLGPPPPPPADRHVASPEKERDRLSDAAQLLSDPWSSELISDFLSTMSPPLTSHPQCISWQRRLPDIGPKMTISMGKASLRVDRVLGRGAFATVYQATDPAGSDKMVLKVQKPANPWEFYIHTQLDRRLPPSVRHLFARVRTAHVFTDGSVLLGELHSYGTLLNAVNVYKGLGDKVMPQPLVIYFTVCVLRMLEELHAARIIHADVKPDNFMLGQRFAENDDFEPENLEHGLVLIDLGQSIDMDLFPPGTAFTAACSTSGFRCTQMLGRKPWSYQTDYFGVAGTVHVMLLGTYMQVVEEDGVWRTCATFRRNPHSEMWLHLFHTLLNISACRPVPATLADLRRRLTAVLQRNYRGKMASLKSRLLILLLESCKAARR
ncbi:mitotic checkpoint serine/threonine-protein kinase BUB1 isoform X2 [Phyllopteryx taeniolatus]|uniref:mitotic checkpoint serine/threonine-protein kinase BUB1 isoform X2 n=1 Tax=Phyllopteryx taeniolatus TaxID=161469 RepID=UPI002AD3D678|nr:mitotic checkpoint serine/threonine-protein kinase BUB1 isoform X2 [Phyllopteryx taeniolatus]